MIFLDRGQTSSPTFILLFSHGDDIDTTYYDDHFEGMGLSPFYRHRTFAYIEIIPPCPVCCVLFAFDIHEVSIGENTFDQKCVRKMGGRQT